MNIADLKKTSLQKMQKSVEALKANLAKVRTGRAHVGLLDHVHVDYYGSMMLINQVANITLADLNGRVILIDEVENAYQQQRQYDTSGLANGTYLVRIATKEGTKTKKFVVQH